MIDKILASIFLLTVFLQGAESMFIQPKFGLFIRGGSNQLNASSSAIPTFPVNLDQSQVMLELSKSVDTLLKENVNLRNELAEIESMQTHIKTTIMNKTTSETTVVDFTKWLARKIFDKLGNSMLAAFIILQYYDVLFPH